MTSQRRTFAELKEMANDLLREQELGVLATGKRDGSPQQSIVAYEFTGDAILISTSVALAKTKNIRKQPKVSFAVTDGPRCVVVYGTAEVLTRDEAVAKFGKGPVDGPQPGERVMIHFPIDTYRWARIEPDVSETQLRERLVPGESTGSSG